MKKTNLSFKQQLDGLASVAPEFVTTIRGIISDMDSYRAQRDEMTAARDRNRDLFNTSCNKVSHLAPARDHFQTLYHETQVRLDRALADTTRAAKDVSRLSVACHDLESDFKRLVDDRDHFQKLYQAAEYARLVAVQDLANATFRQSEAVDYNDVVNHLREVEEDLHNVMAECDSLRLSVDDLQTRNDNQKEYLAQDGRTITRLTADLKDCKNEVDMLQAAARLNSHDSLQERNDNQCETIQCLRGQLRACQDEKNILAKFVEANDARVLELEEDVAELEAQLDDSNLEAHFSDRD